jgi:hypothetical protein
MRSTAKQYEVRCAHCDVTFPVETRTCIHCGGATSEAADSSGAEPDFQFDSRFEDEGVLVRTSDAPARSDSIRPPSPQEIPLEDQDADSEAPGVGRSILGSMGSLIWVALLIAFSLSGRLCGE